MSQNPALGDPFHMKDCSSRNLASTCLLSTGFVSRASAPPTISKSAGFCASVGRDDRVVCAASSVSTRHQAAGKIFLPARCLRRLRRGGIKGTLSALSNGAPSAHGWAAA